MQNLVAAYNLGKNLAFYKFAEPDLKPITPQQVTPIEQIKPSQDTGRSSTQNRFPIPSAQDLAARARAESTPESPTVQAPNTFGRPVQKPRDFSSDMRRDDEISQGTLLARSANQQILREHNLPYDTIESYADALRREEEAYVSNNPWNPLARKKIRQQLAERVYGDFAQMPESERIGLDRFRERFLHEMPINLTSGTEMGVHTTPGHGGHTFYQNAPEYKAKTLGFDRYREGMEPLHYSGNFQNPEDTEHRFSPNVVYGGPKGDHLRELKEDSSYWSYRDAGIPMPHIENPPVPPMVAVDQSYPSPMMAMLGAKPKILSDRTLMSIPYKFRTDDITKPAYYPDNMVQVPFTTLYGTEGSNESLPYDTPTTAHEMYHHKMNNLKRSSPYIKELLGAGTTTSGDQHSSALNEEFADWYALQAGNYASDKIPLDVMLSAPSSIDDGLHLPLKQRIKLDMIGPRY